MSRRDAYVSGSDAYASGRDAYVSGPDAYASRRDAYVSGPDGYASGRDAYVSGSDAYASGRDAYVSGPDGYASGRDAYVSRRPGEGYDRASMTTCHGRGATIALLLATAACSAGSTVAGPSDGGDDSGSSDATGAVDAPSEADDATSDAADGGALCPADVPEAGTPCSSPQPPFPFEAQCEYGADPHCTTTATCDKQWTVLPCPQSPTGCPAAFDAGAGGACAPVKGVCDYPQGQCGCLGCNGGAACPDLCGPDASPTGTVWQCASWPMPPGCPWPRPLLGTPCSGPPGNRVCDYGVGIFDTCSVPLDPRQACVGGRWVAYIAGG